MAQTKIVVADYDESYLVALERLFVREYKFTAEIILISKVEALHAYFAEPKTIEILVINEKLYDQSFARHNCEHLFILTEEIPDSATGGELFNSLIYKYTTGKVLMDNIISRSGISHATNLHAGVAKVVMVFSPVGGAGQTTIAAGLCTHIARNFRRALFVGADSLQSFGNVLKGKQELQSGVEKTLQEKSKYAYDKIKPMIVTELFDIIPPFSAALASLGVTQGHLMFLIDQIKTSGDYDFIIVDSGSDFTEVTSKMMAYADQVLLVTTQEEDAVYKLNCLLSNIDCSDTNRFAMVCNKYRAESPNSLLDVSAGCPHTDYIEYDPSVSPHNGEYLANLQSMQKLGQLYI